MGFNESDKEPARAGNQMSKTFYDSKNRDRDQGKYVDSGSQVNVEDSELIAFVNMDLAATSYVFGSPEMQ